jgi:hypothetical protein
MHKLEVEKGFAQRGGELCSSLRLELIPPKRPLRLVR